MRSGRLRGSGISWPKGMTMGCVMRSSKGMTLFPISRSVRA